MEQSMATKLVTVQRFSVISSKSFEQVTTALVGPVGHPDMGAFLRDITAAKTYPEVEKIVTRAIGPSGLMEFARYDLGNVLRKELGDKAPHSLRFVIGNPLIMKQLVEHVPDAGSYAPVTILVDERPDGVHLSYDTMASFLAPYGNAGAMKVAQDLDAKVEALLTAAAK
jgi:uncharacterized protein (DUF302 family)